LFAPSCIARAATGYEDKSTSARLQAKYTDLILINKHEELTDRQYDSAMDDVFELNPDTAKVPSHSTSGMQKTLYHARIRELYQLEENLFASGSAIR
jgi:G3E family GTPase